MANRDSRIVNAIYATHVRRTLANQHDANFFRMTGKTSKLPVSRYHRRGGNARHRGMNDPTKKRNTSRRGQGSRHAVMSKVRYGSKRN